MFFAILEASYLSATNGTTWHHFFEASSMEKVIIKIFIKIYNAIVRYTRSLEFYSFLKIFFFIKNQNFRFFDQKFTKN
jgi:hypothetical protein